MDNILNKPYKISLWEDEQWFILELNGIAYESTTIDSGAIVRNDYIKEIKIADIGGSDIHSPIMAFNPKLVNKLNGTNELTFSIFYKYYDEEDFTLKDNPWIKNCLVNERKVKLEYDDKVYDFIIKQVDKNQSNNTFTYTCIDRYIDELSKNGYELEFSAESLNGAGTLEQLAGRVLEGSDWNLGSVEKIQNTANEVLYTYSVEEVIQGRVLTDFSYKGETVVAGTVVTIPSGSTIYICYSSVSNEEPIQFFYRSDEKFELEADGTILNSPNYQIVGNNPFLGNLGVSNYRGNKLVAQQQAYYLPSIDKFCTVYTKNNADYYCIQDNVYTSCDAIQQFLTNNTNFASTQGWVAYSNSPDFDTIESLTYKLDGDQPYLELLGPLLPSAPIKVVNSGIFDNRALFKDGLVEGTKYEFLIGGTIGNDLSVNAVLYKAGSGGGITVTIPFINTNQMVVGPRGNYYRFEATINNNQACSKEELLDFTTLNFELVFQTSAFKIYDTLLFEYLTDGSNPPKMVIPDPTYQYDEIVKTSYSLFPVSTFTPTTQIDELIYTDKIVSDVQTPEDFGYTKKLTNDYTRMRSITAEKTNRFNIIQKLCETFECWADFQIIHNSDLTTYYYYGNAEGAYIPGKRYYIYSDRWGEGNTIDWDFDIAPSYDSAPENWPTGYFVKEYDKVINFKKYVGKDNDVGFRYGVNLKSIQRKDDSQNIVTKLIVEPNILTDGTCTIQGASLNTLGEKWIYNFDYYVTHKLIDNSNLLRDLYNNSETNGLGFFTATSQLNKQIMTQNRLMTSLGKAIAKQYAYYQAAVQAEVAAETELVKLEYYLDTQNIPKSGKYYVESPLYNNLVNEYIRKYNNQQIIYDTKSAEATSWYSQYIDTSNKYTAADETIKVLQKRKEALSRDFLTKYSIYVKEGTWQSDDYIDDNLYYIDALAVSATSAKPQVTYNINVMDLSQINGYGNYQFSIGDKSYVEDTELFGWKEDGTPYKEEIIVSELGYNLDDPSQNSIKIQNYKTQFDDLFQRIATETQSLQYNKGNYARAAAAVTNNGTINSALLDKSLNENVAVISNAYDQSVTWDTTGITIRSIASGHGNEIVRLVSGGIVLSNDGGASWHTGITADGINADVINTGTLNTNLIKIYNAAGAPTFIWDDTGLNAYALDGQIVSSSKYVRFDSNGIRGISDGNTAVPIFSLTYDGFELNALNDSDGNDNYVKITTNEQAEPTVFDPTISLKKIFRAGYTRNNVKTDNFIVYEDGTVYANNGYFTGHVEASSGTFTGELKAESIKVLDNGVWTNILEGTKIKNNYLDMGTITIDGNSTSISMSGNNATITLGDPNGNHIEITSSGITISGYNPGQTYTDDDVKRLLDETYQITNTTITGTSIASPKIISGELDSPIIKGNTITAQKAFSIVNETANYGFLGPATGTDGVTTTNGVALAAYANGVLNNGIININTNTPYIIATTAGVRMTYNAERHLYVDTNGISMNYDNNTFLNFGEGTEGLPSGSTARERMLIQFNDNNKLIIDGTGITIWQNGNPVSMGTAVFG